MTLPLDALLILLLAPVAGAILGLPAQFTRRPAGVRTHALVSLGAALFCLAATARADAVGAGDATRAVQGIASGVGFIGAATILKGEGVVRGINTAASIWIAAAVGAAMVFAASPLVGLAAATFGTIINWTFMELDTRVVGLPDELDQGDPLGG